MKMTTPVLERSGKVIEKTRHDEFALREGRMYAIAFDMDIDSLRKTYGDPDNNAYIEIRKVLEKHGFNWQQGSVYFGGDRINAVTCVLAPLTWRGPFPGLRPQ